MWGVSLEEVNRLSSGGKLSMESLRHLALRFELHPRHLLPAGRVQHQQRHESRVVLQGNDKINISV